MAETKKTLHGPSVQNQRILFIDVNEEKIRPSDAYWVVYNRDGVAVDFFTSDTVIKDNFASAARRHWGGDTPALLAALSGYHLNLFTKQNFIRNVAPKLAIDDTPEEFRVTGRRQNY